MNRYLYRIFIFFCFLLFSSVVFSQELKSKYPFDQWTVAELDAANTAKNVDYLTVNERNVIFYLNLARINGKLFAQTYAQKYIDSTKWKKNIYVTSLITTLKNQSYLKPLIPSKEVSDIAKKYAILMGKEGFTGHRDTDKRFSALKTGYKSRGENCDYGNKNSLAIVMNLLIDDGISSYGHRKNILDKEYNYIGVSIQPHKTYKYTCVMDFIYLEKK